MERFGTTFKTLRVNDLKLPDQAWSSNDLFGYVERLITKLSAKILVSHVSPKMTNSSQNKTRSSRDVTKKIATDLKEKNKRFELPLNKTGTVSFSGTVRHTIYTYNLQIN